MNLIETTIRNITRIETALSLAPSTALFGTGDMGIGNTTASSTIVSLFSGAPVADVTGRGTGIDNEQRRHKAADKRFSTACQGHTR
jgi:NaMN:DMB phosphoribosyltransferase